MLKAYLDDSGTHDTAPVIVMGGVIASEEAWNELEPRWQALLTEYGLTKMHMNKMRHGRHGFEGWLRFKKCRAVTRFRRLIVETGGRLIASAVARADWNAACSKSDLAEVFADPIDFLQAMALRKSLESKRAITEGHEQVAVTFDCRNESLIAWDWMAKGYERRQSDRFVGYAFGRTEKVLPLQAADMVAYEAFVFQCDRLRQGVEPAPRPNLKRLTQGMASDMAYFTEGQLLEFMTKLGSAR